MTALAKIPPRLLTEEQVAEYLGEIPVAEVTRQGIGRVMLGRYARYDRFAIDAWLDARTGLTTAAARVALTIAPQDDAEAALARFQDRR